MQQSGGEIHCIGRLSSRTSMSMRKSAVVARPATSREYFESCVPHRLEYASWDHPAVAQSRGQKLVSKFLQTLWTSKHKTRRTGTTWNTTYTAWVYAYWRLEYGSLLLSRRRTRKSWATFSWRALFNMDLPSETLFRIWRLCVP